MMLTLVDSYRVIVHEQPDSEPKTPEELGEIAAGYEVLAERETAPVMRRYYEGRAEYYRQMQDRAMMIEEITQRVESREKPLSKRALAVFFAVLAVLVLAVWYAAPWIEGVGR